MSSFLLPLSLALLLHAFPAAAALSPLPPGATTQAADPARPRLTREEKFSAWGLSCSTARDAAGKEAERCMVSQLVGVDPKHPRVVLGVTVDYLNSATVPTMRLRFAAGAQSKAGIGIRIDNSAEMRLPISNCDARRCEAVGQLTPEVLKVWRNGKLAQLAFIGADGQQVLLPIPLKGFDQALTALSRQRR